MGRTREAGDADIDRQGAPPPNHRRLELLEHGAEESMSEDNDVGMTGQPIFNRRSALVEHKAEESNKGILLAYVRDLRGYFVRELASLTRLPLAGGGSP